MVSPFRLYLNKFPFVGSLFNLRTVVSKSIVFYTRVKLICELSFDKTVYAHLSYFFTFKLVQFGEKFPSTSAGEQKCTFLSFSILKILKSVSSFSMKRKLLVKNLSFLV